MPRHSSCFSCWVLALIPASILKVSAKGAPETYKATLRMIADHPWFGTGLGTFAEAFPAYRSADTSMWGTWDMAHNTLLEIATEMGLPIAALVIVAWIRIFGPHSWRSRASARPHFPRLGAGSGHVVGAAFDDRFHLANSRLCGGGTVFGRCWFDALCPGPAFIVGQGWRDAEPSTALKADYSPRRRL